MSSPARKPDDIAVIVVMGVAGSGKTTIGERLAAHLGWTYLDADWLHPHANVEKMRGGVPLTDEDRRPWLNALAARIDALRGEGRRVVVACSALRRAYRDLLLGSRGHARLVYLKGDRETVAKRLATREGHYMPAALVDSQFATLEEPAPDEQAIVISIDASPGEIVAASLAAVSARGALPGPA